MEAARGFSDRYLTVKVRAGLPVAVAPPLAPVTLMAYAPAGVPVVPPPTVVLLLLQAGMRNRLIRTMPSRNSPNSFLRRESDELIPAPNSVMPKTGRIVARNTPLCRSKGPSRRAMAAVVATFKVAVALPLADTVTNPPLGLLKLQLGPLATAGETEHASCTWPAKPAVEVTVIVALAETPALPDVGESAPLLRVKFALAPLVRYFATKASPVPPYEG